LYKKEVYEDVKSKHPDAKITEMTKIISGMWAKVDEATKTRLEAVYQKNKAKHDEEKETYEKKYGKI
jgi:hypothetical protein